MNDQLFAYYMYAMANAGVFSSGDYEVQTLPENFSTLLTMPITIASAEGCSWAQTVYPDTASRTELREYSTTVISATSEVYAIAVQNAAGAFRNYFFSEAPFTLQRTTKTTKISTGDVTISTTTVTGDNTNSYTFDNKTANAYYEQHSSQSGSRFESSSIPITTTTNISAANNASVALWLLKYGDTRHTEGVDGISDQPNATLPNTNGWDTPESTLQSLQNQYPGLWNNRAEQNVYDPDTDTTKKITYIPVGFPNGGTGDQPTNDPSKQGGSQAQPTVNPNPDAPDNTPDPTILTLILSLTERLENALKNPTPMTNPEVDPSPDNPVPQGDITLNPDPNPPDTGGGSSPVPIPPTGNASSLWKVYHPSQATIDAFGAWLWSSNFVEQIKKMFNDPMSAIIGLHKVFAPPEDAGTANIKVGYLDSGVPSAYVDQQYVTIDCGSITLREYFGNVFDYEPYTKVAIYLPFIGVQSLSTAEVMRSTINVVYHVDIFTGACLAEVYISRDGGRGCLYTFAGDCSARYPLSSGSYMGIVGGVLSIAGGIAGTVATGGNLLPALLGASSAMTHMHTDVKHSGQISGNAGAMGVKVPFLIVLRPQTAMADSYEHFTGRPANKFALIGEATGYIKCKEVHVDNLSGASDTEKEMVESLLKSGIIV